LNFIEIFATNAIWSTNYYARVTVCIHQNNNNDMHFDLQLSVLKSTKSTMICILIYSEEICTYASSWEKILGSTSWNEI